MKQKVYVAPSLLAADFKNLHRELLICSKTRLNIYILMLWMDILFQIYHLGFQF